MQASVSLQSRLFTWSGLIADDSIMLDTGARTVMIGNTTYKCDNKFDEEVAKIDIEEIKRKEEAKKAEKAENAANYEERIMKEM